MFAALLSFLGGGVVNSMLDKAVAAYKLKLDAANNRDAQALDLAKAEINAEIQARAQAKEIVIAEQGWWVTAIIRPLFVFPLVIYWGKILIWDKVLGWGTTDPLTGMVGDWAGIIIVAYFGSRGLEKVARTLSRR